jgi:DNA-binding NarL/FixJ family response regulator
MRMARVLLADSQPLFNEALRALLDKQSDHLVVGQTSSAEDLIDQVGRLRPELVLVDASLALDRRPTLVEKLLARQPDVKVVVLAQEAGLDLVVAAVRAGAPAVVTKTSGARTVLRTIQAALDGEGVVPRAMLPTLFKRLVELQKSAADSPLSRLSPRERQVLLLLRRGWDNAQIGHELFISPHTVRTHIQNILEKLDMHSKLEAATFAMQYVPELSASP